MGISRNPLLVSLINMVQGNEEVGNQGGGDQSLWDKVLEGQSKKRCQVKKQSFIRKNGGHVRTKRASRIPKKRRARLEGGKTGGNGIVRRVRTLRKLVPHSDQSMGLDGLFRETADYIISLQMKVEVMQIMVKVLSSSDEE
ncbi:hypothetical protein K2173_008099 [Erythroxylum novogranatense]|uniref:Transcription factor UPBEAT1 n=1 Tax=Erythroxylum novogranatense TaxID=1862640 RepID=A0AAV8S983_9ROSI|nr:hypothetical protein K2173_008099 [Erythroxylum novogranatense]